LAYGVKYKIEFLNKQQDFFRVEILAKDYTGGYTILEGGPVPFTLNNSSGDNQIYNPFRPSDAVIEFWSTPTINDIDFPFYTVSLIDFYNDDDTFFRVDFYLAKVNGALASDVLKWTGFLQLDNCEEDIQDRPHLLTLNANDNLGLLENVALQGLTDDQKKQGVLLTELFALILAQTNLPLPVNAYLNIFENNTNDRSVTNTNDLLQQTALYTDNFLNSDGTYKDCYAILSDILTTFRATLFQANGVWNIIRQAEYRYFTSVPGTGYNFDLTTLSAISLSPNVPIGPTQAIIPINENQRGKILRPYQYVKKTFNYNQPEFLIKNSDLQLPPGATPYATSTVGSQRFDDYALATYFPFWVQTHGDTSYLEVVTDTSSDNEIERYIVTPANTTFKGVEFNPIPVTAGDFFDFSLSFRTQTDISDNYHFRVRFILVTPDNFYYNLTTTPGGGSTINVHWTGPFAVAGWDSFSGDSAEVLGSSDTSQYSTWSLSSFVETGGKLPVIPVDGVLLIEVRGNNDTNVSEPHVTTFWKDIVIAFTNEINQSTKIIGQYHKNSQTSLTKNQDDNEINYDDSPRNTISGTFLRTPLVTFDAGIGDLYFFKTAVWHRGVLTETKRLGEINTFEELFIQRKARTIVNGDFFGLRYFANDQWNFISLLNIVQFDFYPGKNFIFGIMSVDYMAAEITGAVLYELYDTGEVDANLSNTYLFNYLYSNT
jgi:hypothetical protein